ncbi:TPA: hypothetical protein ACG3OI_003524, partial [Legionella pneumophila]
MSITLSDHDKEIIRLVDNQVKLLIERTAPDHVIISTLIDFIPDVRCIAGVVCGRGRNPTLRLWPTIFSGKIDVFPGDRRSRLIS